MSEISSNHSSQKSFQQGSSCPPTNQQVKKMSKRKDGLRKGKWTIEEERFANKIIEVFNAGLLKLQDEEKGITLRAYLAAKLDCDPMRITKKYTGASCLGKKVYHFDQRSLHAQDAENARRELDGLERQFKAKLEQMNRKKNNDHSNSLDNFRLISTPAIDALVLSSKPNVPQPPAITKLPIVTTNYQQVPYYQTAYPPQPMNVYPYYHFPGNMMNAFPVECVVKTPTHHQNIEFTAVNDSLRSRQMYQQLCASNNSSLMHNHYMPTVPFTQPNHADQLQPAKSLEATTDKEKEADNPVDEIINRQRTFHEIPLSEEEPSEVPVKRQKTNESNLQSNAVNAASNSWIMNQFQKISSHENLLDMFDSSKSVANPASYETSPATKLATRESVENLLKLINPGMVQL